MILKAGNLEASVEMDKLLNLYNAGKIDKATLEAKRQELHETLNDNG